MSALPLPHDVSWLLLELAQWNAERGAVCAVHAQQDLSNVFGTIVERERIDCPEEHYAKMYQHMQTIRYAEPQSPNEAGRLLDVAIAILQKREVEPDGRLAQGPVVEILVNVRNALFKTPSEKSFNTLATE